MGVINSMGSKRHRSLQTCALLMAANQVTMQGDRTSQVGASITGWSEQQTHKPREDVMTIKEQARAGTGREQDVSSE